MNYQIYVAIWKCLPRQKPDLHNGKQSIDRCECKHSLLENCTDECNCKAHNYMSKLMALRDDLNDDDIRLV